MLVLKEDLKFEHIIDNMIENNIDAYLLQETCLIGTSVQTIRGCTTFYHGLSKANCSRGKRGVAIVILPKLLTYYENAGGMPAVHAPDDDDNCLRGRHSEITLKLKRIFRVKKDHFVKLNLKG